MTIVLSLCCVAMAAAQCRFDRAVAVGTGTTNVRGVAVGPDGSVYVTGTFYDSTVIGSIVLKKRRGNNESFLARYSSDLELLWAVDLRGTREMPGVAVDSNGNVFVVGWGPGMIIDSTTTLNAVGYHDVFLAKYDTTGRFQWARNIGGVDVDNGRAVVCDGQGGAIVTGSFTEPFVVNGEEYVSKGRRDIMTAAFDSAGVIRWVQTAGGPGDDYGRGIAVGRDGSTYVTGSFDKEAQFGEDNVGPLPNYGLYVIHISRSGSYEWVYAPGGWQTSEGNGVAVAPDGNIWVTGRFVGTLVDGMDSVTAYGSSDVMLMRLDPTGRLLSMRRDGSPRIDEGNGIAIAVDGTIYVGGHIEARRIEPAWFGDDTITAQDADAFVVQYRSDGQPECVRGGGGEWFDVGYGVAAGPAGTAYLVGGYSRYARFDTNMLVSDTASPGTGFIARARFDSESDVRSPEPDTALALRAVSNTRARYMIHGLVPEKPGSVHVYDLLGREVYTVPVAAQGSGPVVLDLGVQAPGVYIICVREESTVQSFKVLVR